MNNQEYKNLLEALLQKTPYQEFYHTVPELEIQGTRYCKQLIFDYDIPPLVVNKKVLDIGTNMGMVSIYLSPYVEKIDAIDIVVEYVSLAKILQEFYDISNISFQQYSLEEFAKYCNNKYDVILSLAVSAFRIVKTTRKQALVSYLSDIRSMMADNGILIFESYLYYIENDIELTLEETGFSFEIIVDTREETHRLDQRLVLKCIKKI